MTLVFFQSTLNITSSALKRYSWNFAYSLVEALGSLYKGAEQNLTLIANSGKAEVEMFGKIINREANMSFIQATQEEFKYLAYRNLFFSKAIAIAPYADKAFLSVDIIIGGIDTYKAYHQKQDYVRVALDNTGGIVGGVLGGSVGLFGGIIGTAVGSAAGFAAGKTLTDQVYDHSPRSNLW